MRSLFAPRKMNSRLITALTWIGWITLSALCVLGVMFALKLTWNDAYNYAQDKISIRDLTSTIMLITNFLIFKQVYRLSSADKRLIRRIRETDDKLTELKESVSAFIKSQVEVNQSIKDSIIQRDVSIEQRLTKLEQHHEKSKYKGRN